MQEVKSVSQEHVVLLVGDALHHQHTVNCFLRSSVIVSGVITLREKKAGLPINFIIRTAKKYGFLSALSQTAARLLYLCRNYSRDKLLYREIFKDPDGFTHGSSLESLTVSSYDDSSVIELLQRKKPSILVVHSPGWVGKKIREFSSVKYVIGGHPGITAKYRGAHSPFWAVLYGDYGSVGWTCFHLDSGVDTGSVIDTGIITFEAGETFRSLSWRCMTFIARAQVDVVERIISGETLPKLKSVEANEKTLFHNPGLFDLIKYWLKQQRVR